MASFNATLFVNEHRYPIDLCSQHMHQDVGSRGQPTSRTYSGELIITMRTPPDCVLLAWAASPQQALACRVVFADLDGVVPSFVLTLENAYCLSYEEHFQPNNEGQTAYFCQIGITAERIDKRGVAFTSQWHTPA
jgi:hypothetical protein